MSSFEINKIMGSIFSVILLLLIIKNLSSILYPIQKVTEHNNEKSTKVTNLDPDIDKEEINVLIKDNIQKR